MHPSRKRTRALRVYITPFAFSFTPFSKVLLPVFRNYLVKNYAKCSLCFQLHLKKTLVFGHLSCRRDDFYFPIAMLIFRV